MKVLFYGINTKCINSSNITYDKTAYITIDDGPSKYTNQILDILDRNNVKATFFMINRNMNIYKIPPISFFYDIGGNNFNQLFY